MNRLNTNYKLILLLIVFFISPKNSLASEDYADLDLKAGQMVLVGFRGTGEDDSKDYKESLNSVLKSIEKGRVGGIIYFSRDAISGSDLRNISSLKQVKNLSKLLQSKAQIPLFISVDQEGGLVRRLKTEHGMPDLPSPEEMGLNRPEKTYAYADETANNLKKVGINLNFAPSLDLNINPKNPIIGALGRSFSESEDKVVVHASSFARALSEKGIIVAYKHFPGHGSSIGDTHFGITDISLTWEERELAPYEEILPLSPPAMVMVGHMVHKGMDSKYPSSLSKKCISGVLRDQLGWEGVVITDDLDMGAIDEYDFSLKEKVRLAIQAGVDILLFGNNLVHDPHLADNVHGAIVELVEEGKVSMDRIDESYKRIMTLKSNFILRTQ